MPPLVAAQRLGKAFGARSLFSGLSFGIEPGERIGLIGPNGAGKSTLLSILAGETTPDDGAVVFQGGVSVGLVPQIPSFAEGATVRSVVLVMISDATPTEIAVRVAAHLAVCALLIPRYQALTGADRDPHK